MNKYKLKFLNFLLYFESWKYKSWSCRFGFHKYQPENILKNGKILYCCSPVCPAVVKKGNLIDYSKAMIAKEIKLKKLSELRDAVIKRDLLERSN